MKRKPCLACMLAICLMASTAYAQNVAINEDNSTPNPNAILDVKSFNKGILIPRLSSAARTAIPNTKGLLVYDTTTNTFWFNTGTAWQNLVASTGGGSGWSLTGNSGTTSANFLGTIDNVPLVVKVNSTQSGRIETGFAQNTYWGYSAGLNANPDSASGNTGIGSYTLFSNTGGRSNTALGARSLFVNTKANDNTSIGAFAMELNTTGFSNTAVGSFALHDNLTGKYNTAVGANALKANTSYMFENTAVGGNAMLSNTGGSDNTAIGYNAMQASTAGWYNTSLGRMSLFRSTTGSDNTALGTNSMDHNTTGGANTAVGEISLYSNTTGNANTAVGEYAFFFNQTGSYNTMIGTEADGPTSGNLVNATAIGYLATVNASNKVRIGNSAITVIEGQVPFTTPSDGRYKFQVQEDVKGLDFVNHLRPVTYQFDTKRFDDQLRGSANIAADTLLAHPGKIARSANASAMQAAYDESSGIRRSGFIAQEVEKAAIASGYNFSGLIKPKTEQDHYSLSYESFVVPLVKAVQELSAKVDALEKQISELKQQKRNAE